MLEIVTAVTNNSYASIGRGKRSTVDPDIYMAE